MYLRYTLLLACFALSTTGYCQSVAGKKFNLLGYVIDAQSNTLSGATISCYVQTRHYHSPQDSQELPRVLAGEDGKFELSLPENGCEVVVSKPGLAPIWRQFWNLTADVEETFVLPEPAVLAGKVVDDSGKPVRDAEVSVALAFFERDEGGGRPSYAAVSGRPARDYFSTRTSAEGEFRIENFPPKVSADLAVRSPGKVLRGMEREYVSPENMMCRAGDTNINLVLEPAGQIAGKVVFEEEAADAATQASAQVWLLRQSGGFRGVDPIPVEPDGKFLLSEVASGEYRLQVSFGTNRPALWVAEHVSVTVRAPEKVENVRLLAGKGGLVEVSVVLEPDKKPVSGANINLQKENFVTAATTDESGKTVERVPLGEYQVVAYRNQSRSEPVSVTVEAEQKNRVEVIMKPPPVITGRVVMADGKAAARVPVKLFPNWYGSDRDTTLTDDDGRYQLEWEANRFAGMNRNFALVVQDTNLNLAVCAELDPETKELYVTLEPALTISGRVHDPEGQALTNATVTLYLWSGNSGSSLDSAPAQANADGTFELRALPSGQRYSVSVTAAGYGSASRQVEEDTGSGKIVDLEPITLRVADRKLAGQVVDQDEKPVNGAWVHIYGPDQPNTSTRSDSEGRFRFEAVCEGNVQVSASSQNAYGNANAEGGDTNVVVQLGRQDRYVRAPARTGMAGKPLPDLGSFGISNESTPADKPLLLCLVDTEQRPSRRCLQEVAAQFEQLKQQGVCVVALQCGIISEDEWTEWSEANSLPFEIGRVSEGSSESRWATGVETLPWLILRDATGKVSAEGFDMEDLAEKLKAVQK